MPSKKRKYNARFPAGRIKKIMQTDEEVGKVAQAVPIIISRTLELFVESLLSKAMQVTLARNAKTLSPSHVKQCILAESRFDFLKDLVKNIPDVSAAEEKELMSAESSPNTSRFPEPSVQRRVARQDSNSSSSSDARVLAGDATPATPATPTTPATPAILTPPTEAIDLTKRPNFYQETLPDDRQGVIKINPTYATPQPSTSTTIEQRIPIPKSQPLFHIDLSNINNNTSVKTPVTPVLNIDFTKGVALPEIKVLDANAAGLVKKPIRQYTRLSKPEPKKEKEFPPKETSVSVTDVSIPASFAKPLDLDHLSSGNLQIDEDYDT